MSWWCAAQDTAWSWTWQPYLGVWMLVASLVVFRLLADIGRPISQVLCLHEVDGAGEAVLGLWVCVLLYSGEASAGE